jgi:hypothetical protein
MDYKKLVCELIDDTIIVDINELKLISVMYKNKLYNFDDFLKEYQLNNDPIELFENLIERGYKFDSSHFAYYINNAYIDCNDLIDWYRRIQRIRVY